MGSPHRLIRSTRGSMQWAQPHLILLCRHAATVPGPPGPRGKPGGVGAAGRPGRDGKDGKPGEYSEHPSCSSRYPE